MRRRLLLSVDEKNIYNEALKKRPSAKSLKAEMKKYSVLKSGKVQYVVVEAEETRYRSKDHECPDFLGTGKALCGVLTKGETLLDFVIHREAMKPVIEQRCIEHSKLYKKMWANKRKKEEV